MSRAAFVILLLLVCSFPLCAEEERPPLSGMYRIREEARIQAHTPWVRTLDISHDGKWIVTGGPDRRAVVWSAKTLEATGDLILPRYG